jgi:hypothetical protein
MSDPCPRCPNLEQQIAQLQARCTMLERRVVFLHDVLSTTLGAVRALTLFVIGEQEEPSLSRARVLSTIQMRLLTLLEEAQGRL